MVSVLPDDKDYPADEQGIDEKKEGDIYDENERDEMVEDDEISPIEDAFMAGEEDRGELSECSYCGKMIGTNKSEVVEKVIDGKRHWFCSVECAEKGVAEKE